MCRDYPKSDAVSLVVLIAHACCWLPARTSQLHSRDGSCGLLICDLAVGRLENRANPSGRRRRGGWLPPSRPRSHCQGQGAIDCLYWKVHDFSDGLGATHCCHQVGVRVRHSIGRVIVTSTSRPGVDLPAIADPPTTPLDLVVSVTRIVHGCTTTSSK